MNRERKPRKKCSRKTNEQRLQWAELMFIYGKTIPQIMRELEYTSANTLYKYMKTRDWIGKRERVWKEGQELYLERIFSKALSETEGILGDLKTIREKAIEVIDSGELLPKKYSEASSAYIDSVNLERKIRIEGLQLTFIADVAQVLKEEIQDENILNRIAAKLRKLFESYQRPLLESGK